MKLQSEKMPFFVAVWLVVAAAATVLAGLSYVTAQQVTRMGANAAPLQATHEILAILKQGVDPSRILPPTQTEITDSSSVFAAVFDEKGGVVSSSVQVDGKNPSVPNGVFEYAKQHGEDRFTWQPKSGVREAAIVVPYSASVQADASSTPTTTKGYVMTGQSLTEVERIAQDLLKLTGVAWLFTLVLSLLLCWVFFKDHAKHHVEKEIGETVV